MGLKRITVDRTAAFKDADGEHVFFAGGEVVASDESITLLEALGFTVTTLGDYVAPSAPSPGGGENILTGSGAPDDGDGAEGDLYIRSNGDVYKKGSSTWGGVLFSIKGATGAGGAAGSAGAAGAASTVAGPKGDKGDKGDQGDAGGAGVAAFSGVSVTVALSGGPVNQTFLSDTEDYDTDGYHAAGANNWKFVAPFTGYYLLDGYVRVIADATAQGVVGCSFAINGGGAEQYSNRLPIPGDSDVHAVQAVKVVHMTAGDYAYMTMLMTHSSPLDIVARFQMRYLGA